jgi:hypothetical protein
VESHYRSCLYAGVDISGNNAEVMPAQVNKSLKVFKIKQLGMFQIFPVGIPSGAL